MQIRNGQGTIYNGLIVSGSSQITGSLSVTDGITGSLAGTSSWSINSITASYAPDYLLLSNTASMSVSSASYASTASSADNFTVRGTLTAQTLIVQTITSSVIYNSGSNVFGDSLADNQMFTGSVYITGSLNLAGLSSGSVLFAGTNGSITQDNTNLFWDNTNKRLGIGTSSPANTFHISSFNTTNSQVRIGAMEIQSYALNNTWFGDNIFFNGSNFQVRQTGTTGMFYFLGNEGQFRLTTSSTAGSTISTSYSQLKINNDGTFAVGTGIISTPGTYTNAKFIVFGSTGNVAINSIIDAGYRLDVTGTSRLNGKSTLTGSVTATTALAQGVLVSPTLVAAANNDVLVGMDITPTFTNGAFTGLTNYALRVTGTSYFTTLVNIHQGAQSTTLGLGVYEGLTTSGNNIRIYNTNGNNGYLAFSTIGNISTGGASALNLNGSGVYINYRGGGYPFSIADDVATRFFITDRNSGGNVLIGSTVNYGFKLDVAGSARITTGLTVTGSLIALTITGSLQGTASWANNATTSSYSIVTISSSYSNNATNADTASYVTTAQTASYVLQAVSSSYALTANSAPLYVLSSVTSSMLSPYILASQTSSMSVLSSSYAATASYANNFTVAGTLTAQTLVVQTITSSVDYVTGSTRFGSTTSNTHQFTGSVGISGSLSLAGFSSGSMLFSDTNGLVSQDNTNLFWDNTNKRLGIGVNTPAYKLQINGDLGVVSGTRYIKTYIASSNGNIEADGNSTLVLSGGQVAINGYAGITSTTTIGNFTVNSSRAISLNTIGGSLGTFTINSSAAISITSANTYDTTINSGNNLLLQNDGTSSLQIFDTTRNVLIQNGGTFADNGYRLDVSGSARITTGLTVTGSLIAPTITGSLQGTASWANNAITASYADSFTVSNLLTINSSSLSSQQVASTVVGLYQTIASVATGSYRCAFFDYVAFSGSISRAGTVYSIWSGSATEYTEMYTNDIGGSTSGISLQAAISGSNIQLQATSSAAAWTIRSLVRLL